MARRPISRAGKNRKRLFLTIRAHPEPASYSANRSRPLSLCPWNTHNALAAFRRSCAELRNAVHTRMRRCFRPRTSFLTPRGARRAENQPFFPAGKHDEWSVFRGTRLMIIALASHVVITVPTPSGDQKHRCISEDVGAKVSSPWMHGVPRRPRLPGRCAWAGTDSWSTRMPPVGLCAWRSAPPRVARYRDSPRPTAGRSPATAQGSRFPGMCSTWAIRAAPPPGGLLQGAVGR